MTARSMLIGAAILMALGGPVRAQAQDEELPPGHPPVPGEPAVMPAPPLPPGAEELPPGHPAVPGDPMGGLPPGQGMDPQTRSRLQDVLRSPTLATAQPSRDVPVGSVRVLVVDENGDPVNEAAVDVGSLAQGERQRWNDRTDADGIATFEDLPVGSGQAYRVNVPYGGATTSTAPFNLPTDQGYEVRVTRLPVTRDDRFVFFHVFRVIVEQRGERMHVIHQTELTNAGNETFAFPENGLRVALPEEATAFQFQRVMNDQRVEELSESHEYVMRGSIPPGTVRLAFAYDLPVGGGDLEIPIEIPLRFFGPQVIGEALPELRMEVAGMPRPQRLDTQGQPCEDSQQTPGCAWVTSAQRGPDDEAIRNLTVRLTGIPGPSPVRWFAVGLASILALGGAFFGLRKKDTAPSDKKARRRRRQQLLDEARELAEELREGEIGPEYHRKRRAVIERELAALLYLEEHADPTSDAGPAKA